MVAIHYDGARHQKGHRLVQRPRAHLRLEHSPLPGDLPGLLRGADCHGVWRLRAPDRASGRPGVEPLLQQDLPSLRQPERSALEHERVLHLAHVRLQRHRRRQGVRDVQDLRRRPTTAPNDAPGSGDIRSPHDHRQVGPERQEVGRPDLEAAEGRGVQEPCIVLQDLYEQHGGQQDSLRRGLRPELAALHVARHGPGDLDRPQNLLHGDGVAAGHQHDERQRNGAHGPRRRAPRDRCHALSDQMDAAGGRHARGRAARIALEVHRVRPGACSVAEIQEPEGGGLYLRRRREGAEDQAVGPPKRS
mmetsp:Transcript_126973/g.367549  ORF Transcript_126973/g.367549 Transcript_126973/m.367549 type:complete len:304 (+) Transcript_126973:4098-5009(+)